MINNDKNEEPKKTGTKVTIKCVRGEMTEEEKRKFVKTLLTKSKLLKNDNYFNKKF
jgi:hypothetical protein